MFIYIHIHIYIDIYIHKYIHKYIHTYIDAFEYLSESNPRMINKVFIGTNERSDVWVSAVVLINIGHNVHCNMQINLWNLQGFSGATKLPFFHFRCVCVYVSCLRNCSLSVPRVIWENVRFCCCNLGSDTHLQNLKDFSKVTRIFGCHYVSIFHFRCVYVRILRNKL